MRLEDLETPALVADLDAVEANIAKMAQIMNGSAGKAAPAL